MSDIKTSKDAICEILKQFHSNSSYPDAMDFDVIAYANKILAITSKNVISEGWISEPIYQVLGASGAWYDLEESQYNRFNIFKYRIIYLAPQPTTEDVNCINRLVNVLNDSEVVLASQPQSLKN